MNPYCVKRRYLLQLAKKTTNLDYDYDELNKIILNIMKLNTPEEVMWKIADDYFKTDYSINKSKDEILTDIKFKVAAFLQSDLVKIYVKNDSEMLQEQILGNLIIDYIDNHMSKAEKLINDELQLTSVFMERLKKWGK